MFQVNLAEELVNIGQKKISRIKHAETKGFFFREEPKQYSHTAFLKNNLTEEGGGKRS